MEKQNLLLFLGTKSISDCRTPPPPPHPHPTRDTKISNCSALVMRKEEERAEALMERKRGGNRREKKAQHSQGKCQGKESHRGWDSPSISTCNHEFSSDHKFCYCTGIWKGLEEVRAQILLISLLCPCSLSICRTLKAGSGK